MHNYEKNIHIGDVKSIKSKRSKKKSSERGGWSIGDMWSSRGKWDFYENRFVKKSRERGGWSAGDMWISGVKSVSIKDICARDKNIATCETKPLLK